MEHSATAEVIAAQQEQIIQAALLTAACLLAINAELTFAQSIYRLTLAVGNLQLAEAVCSRFTAAGQFALKDFAPLRQPGADQGVKVKLRACNPLTELPEFVPRQFGLALLDSFNFAFHFDHLLIGFLQAQLPLTFDTLAEAQQRLQ
ncbi:MAG TPA: hypothetical protein VMH85_05265 [Terriglobales bacterium]|nr:hypothetical protein [Terriglobales bacterium]